MQEPVRYYITKRGEEPTVRSVDATTESNAPQRPVPTPARAVERLVKGAIRGRSSQR